MKRIDSIQDDIDRMITYEFIDGSRLRVSVDTLENIGINNILRMEKKEHLVSTNRIDILQFGKKIGTVPATFDNRAIKSISPFYIPREGDFISRDGKWIASNTLGPGDLSAIVGFIKWKS